MFVLQNFFLVFCWIERKNLCGACLFLNICTKWLAVFMEIFSQDRLQRMDRNQINFENVVNVIPSRRFFIAKDLLI